MADTDSNNPPGDASTENSVVEANGSSEDAVDVSLAFFTVELKTYQ